MTLNHPLRRRVLPGLCLLACTVAPIAVSAQGAAEERGILDRPVVIVDQTAPGVRPQPPSFAPAFGLVEELDQAELEDEVEQEIEALETLPRPQLQQRADDGERAAQVVLGADFAREAAMLGFAPAAANDALADAARWYSAAASRGFPGAPSLDQAGVRFFPIRIQREP